MSDKQPKPTWVSAQITGDNTAPAGDTVFLLFPENTSYPKLPYSQVLIRTTVDDKKRYVIATTGYANTKADGAPLYGLNATLVKLGLKPSLQSGIEYRKARWYDIVLRGGRVRTLSIVVASLAVVSIALAGYLSYEDHQVTGYGLGITLAVLGVTTVSAIINVVQQFLR